jgi:hypothetical protein
LTLLAITLVLSISTWFSASAVIPQLRDLWNLSPGTSAWLTIAVQVSFVTGSVVSSLFNLADLIAPRHVIFAGAAGSALANLLLYFAGGPAAGFTVTVATIWLIPQLKALLSWRWAFAFLAPGPILGLIAMLRLNTHEAGSVSLDADS